MVIKELDPNNLKRTKKEEVVEEEKKETSVSAGAVDRALDLAFNPTPEKIREVTIIDRIQGRLFPLLDLVVAGRDYILDIARYRQDGNGKEPISPNLLKELMYRTAQWQKSVQGTNLTKITDIALAEMEVKGQEEDIDGDKDYWKD